ncbi:MAG TPA: peptidyl-alpha-hydroxyglycine alpha-amidating lyase family protein [Burkholderiales bacterium]|nr:peptidyl-alpha-hydroxyglycine alpha-amidating lyase family protein [Burkholderiales bacterium]
MATGQHKIEFEALAGWDQLPEGWSYVEVAGVACDSQDRVYVFNRGDYPVIVFDKEGKFLDAWGQGVFNNPHGIFIDHEDHLWLADDKDHTVHKFTVDGERLMTLGESGKASDTGYKINASPVLRAAGPFHRVTNVAVLPSGDMYIADGYGNARVHKFSKDGKLLFSWGEPGHGPGQFMLPHGIALDSAGLVYVADRENSRVQVFTPQGEYVREWTFLNRPYDLFIDDQDMVHIAEGGFHNYMMKRSEGPLPKHDQTMIYPPCGHSPIARVTVCDPDGNIAAQIGGENPVLPGNFIAPHGIWVDRSGDIYVGEVVASAGAVKRMAPLRPHAFQKFQRRAG